MPARRITIEIASEAKGSGIRVTEQQLDGLDRKVRALGASSDHSASRISRLTSGLSSAGASMRDFGSRATAFLSLPIAGAFYGMFQASSDLNESVTKSNAVFRDSSDTINQWADNAIDSAGLAEQTALDAASGFGNLFTQVGLGTGQAAQMSIALTELAADFSSFHNASQPEVIEAMTAAFRGEYDALQRFVPTINAAAVEQRSIAYTGK
jgi:phage-related minor tail protein